jgi:hypothetical protein
MFVEDDGNDFGSMWCVLRVYLIRAPQFKMVCVEVRLWHTSLIMTTPFIKFVGVVTLVAIKVSSGLSMYCILRLC